MGRIMRGVLWLLAALAVLIGVTIAFFAYQGQQTPVGRPDYVALGSSFAAGAGLGSLQGGSPLLCARSVNGYPQLLAHILKLSIVDMTCGGAVTSNVLRGGQFFQGPQIRTINKGTRLVTLTVGGNDLGLVGDLSLLAARRSETVFGWGARQFWGGPTRERDYGKLQSELSALLSAIRERAPDVAIVIATYPALLPPTGTCARLGLSEAEADLMRPVETRFATISRAVARQAGAVFVDMHALGAGHNACSPAPWTYGWTNAGKAPFHPTLEGAEATAEAIAQALRSSPAGISAIGEDDAAGHEAGGVGGEEGDD